MPKTRHSGKVSELPMLSKKEAASNRMRRMEIMRSRRIQTRHNFKYIQSHSVVQNNGDATVITAQQFLSADFDDTSMAQLTQDPFPNLNGRYSDANSSSSGFEHVFQDLVSDVVMANNQDILGDHDGNLSSDSIDINGSIELTQIRHKSKLSIFSPFEWPLVNYFCFRDLNIYTNTCLNVHDKSIH